MDYESYRRAYFVDPAPKPKFAFQGINGVALYFHPYQAAVAYYTQVLGNPAYVEGELTHGWRIGNSWLTLFPAQENDPTNAEIHLYMETPAEAERLQEAFIGTGGSGEPPVDALMFEPLRFCGVKDPFGTQILVLSHLPATSSTTDSDRPEHILNSLVGTWQFTLGKVSGTRTITPLYSESVEWSETFDGRDMQGKGMIGYDAKKEQFFSMTVHSGAGNYDVVTGALDPDKDVIVFEPPPSLTHRPFKSKFQLINANRFTFTAIVQGDDGQWTDAWTAIFERQSPPPP